ncbi:MAG: hypothetical protein M3Q24_00035, partial [bacterium]|nr:hypothetical protein [bacterium]
MTIEGPNYPARDDDSLRDHEIASHSNLERSRAGEKRVTANDDLYSESVKNEAKRKSEFLDRVASTKENT